MAGDLSFAFVLQPPARKKPSTDEPGGFHCLKKTGPGERAEPERDEAGVGPARTVTVCARSPPKLRPRQMLLRSILSVPQPLSYRGAAPVNTRYAFRLFRETRHQPRFELTAPPVPLIPVPPKEHPMPA